MATRLVDTDVFSYLGSSNPTRAMPYWPHLQGQTIALSFITVGEQYAGVLKQIAKGRWSPHHLEKLELRLQQVVIIPFDLEICKAFGQIRSTLTQTIATNDLWIAACAKRHNLELVTNNRKHFEAIEGIKLISEAPIAKSADNPA